MSLCATNVIAQSSERWQFFVTGHLNLYAPYSSNEKMYPVLGYDKDYKPKVLVGGFGAGFAAWKKFNAATSLRLQGSLSRVVYWNNPLDLRDANNNPLGYLQLSSTDYSVGFSGAIHHHFSKAFSIGAGAGVRALLFHYYRIRTTGNPYLDNDAQKGNTEAYKSLMPYIPVEFSYRFERMFINLRYEQSLLKKYNNDLDDIDKTVYGLLLMEVGFRVGR